MLEYDRIDASEGIGVNKTKSIKIMRYLLLLVFYRQRI